MIFSRFLTKKFQTRSPAERKNDFHIKILLETCSATSNYPWNWLSCHQDMYCGLYMKKFKKLEQMRPFSALFGGFYCNFSMALPFVSANSYDPKDICKHICWLLKTERKFSHGTQSQAWRPLKSTFWRSQNGLSHFCLWEKYGNSKITVTPRLRS